MRIADTRTLVGADLLSLITKGMYSSPLAIFREYLQNAADSIGASQTEYNGRVEVDLDALRRRITIRDYGPGLSHSQAERELIPIGRSRKKRGVDRGFRGIGRLAGLAFADSVAFRTRAMAREPVTEIVWDGTALRAASLQKAQTDQVIRDSVKVSTRAGNDWPEQFFEVEIRNVARHAAGLVLNRDVVRSYIGEVCPVPISNTFPFSEQLSCLLSSHGALAVLTVVFTGDETPVTRPFKNSITLSNNRTEEFTICDTFTVPNTEGDDVAAVGWLAHSSYCGMIPKHLRIRGLRAREGNIQVGDERIFDHLFVEDRFNRWCVGEVHIIDSRILPNGRRDYFEPSPHLRNLENQLDALAKGIVSRCRKTAASRNRARKVVTALNQIKASHDLASSGYIKACDARALIQKSLSHLHQLRENSQSIGDSLAKDAHSIDELEEALQNFRPKCELPAFGRIPGAEIPIYQKMFRALIELSSSPEAAKSTIEGILEIS